MARHHRAFRVSRVKRRTALFPKLIFVAEQNDPKGIEVRSEEDPRRLLIPPTCQLNRQPTSTVST